MEIMKLMRQSCKVGVILVALNSHVTAESLKEFQYGRYLTMACKTLLSCEAFEKKRKSTW